MICSGARMGTWEVPDYSAIAGVRPVRRLQDWAALSGVAFRQRFSNQPVVLEGVARAWPAFRKWTRTYLAEKCGADLVTVRTPGMLGHDEVQFSAQVPLRSFAESVASSPGAYLAQWYAYRRHPELYDDIGWLPEYLSISRGQSVLCGRGKLRRRRGLPARAWMASSLGLSRAGRLEHGASVAVHTTGPARAVRAVDRHRGPRRVTWRGLRRVGRLLLVGAGEPVAPKKWLEPRASLDASRASA